MKIGSLFSGYGGLDIAAEAVTAGTTVWHCENDSAASTVLRARWPGVPNLGDIRRVKFAEVEPIDILAGGFPCQDVSNAGRLGGLIRYGDKRNRSGLWSMMARAIDILRPSLVIAENVKGILNANADDFDIFTCKACLDDANAHPMRAFGAVLGDLAQIGYDAAWSSLRASDIGACHERDRVFVIAWPTDSDLSGLEIRREFGGDQKTERATAGGSHPGTRLITLLPTPTTADGTGGPGFSGTEGGLNLRTVVHRLLPAQDWGKYAPAIQRWEELTRPAPGPIDIGPRGGRRLSPRFVEWMMGLPDEFVTGLGLARDKQLTVLGAGVVPQQGMQAISGLIRAVTEDVAA